MESGLPKEIDRDLCWRTEQVFTDGDAFFQTLLAAIEQAKSTVDIESYIFEQDELGERMARALEEAGLRGLRVRCVVDGIGSPDWEPTIGVRLRDAGCQTLIYHSLPWGGAAPASDSPSLFVKLYQGRNSLIRFIRRTNRRNHRKLVVIDGALAFVGSMNVSAVHLKTLSGDAVWRDTAVKLSGPSVKHLVYAFEYTWNRQRRLKRGVYNEDKPSQTERVDVIRSRKQLNARIPPSSPVRINSTARLRGRNFRDLLRRLSKAERRIWITTPYFVPTGTLLSALESAANRGVDVRILVPSLSDVIFMPWVATAFEQGLLRAGAQMYKYLPRVLHAKTILIDDWIAIGSSNMNHRSIFHDLEVDVVLSSAESQRAIETSFQEDLLSSREVLVGEGKSWQLILGKLLLMFKSFL